MKQYKPLKAFLSYLVAAIVLFCLFFFLRIGDSGLTTKDNVAINKAYATAEKSIDTHANAIKQAILSKKAKSREVAEEITGYGAMWKRLKGEEVLRFR